MNWGHDLRTLREINLNLLPVLQELIRHRNVTRAAEALHMSQSAASEALATLRKLFDDELLVRNGRAMVPTDFAAALLPRLDAALSSLQDVLVQPPFDPSVFSGEFTIATADSVVTTVGPPLAASLAIHAPNARLRFIDIDISTEARVHDGSIDLMVGPGDALYPDLHTQLLYDDELVLIMRAGHPLAPQQPTIEQCGAWPFATYHPDAPGNITISHRTLRRAGLKATAKIVVPQFASLASFVAGSDCLSVVPRRVARDLAVRGSLHIANLPFPSSHTMSMRWSKVRHNDPAHRWLRSLLTDLDLEQRPEPPRASDPVTPIPGI